MKNTALGLLLIASCCAAARAAEPQLPDVSTDVEEGIIETPGVEVSTAPRRPPDYTWTLDDVLSLAEQNNPDLQTAQANARAAAQGVGEAVSGYLPQVDGYGFSGRTTLPDPSAGLTANLGLNRPYTDGLVGIRQTVFDFGRGLEDIGAGRAVKRSAREDAVALHNVVELNAEKAFYDVAAAEKLVEVARQSLQQYQETYRRTQVLVQTGVRPSFDLTQAQVELSKAELALINAKNARDLARVALLNVIGMGANRPLRFALDETASGPSAPPARSMDLGQLTAKALEARPEMQSADAQIDAARDRLRAEQLGGYLPNFHASGWYGHYLPDYPDALRSAWGFGLGASWNLFDGLGTTFKVKELVARMDQQKALARAQSQAITAQVASAYMNLVRAEENETVTQKALEFAKENFNYARLRYNANVGTILELLVAESSLVDAEAVNVQAHYRYATAVGALEQAVNVPLAEISR